MQTFRANISKMKTNHKMRDNYVDRLIFFHFRFYIKVNSVKKVKCEQCNSDSDIINFIDVHRSCFRKRSLRTLVVKKPIKFDPNETLI